MSGIKVKRFFEEHYPLSSAYEWDNVGLQVGTMNKELTGILIALDATKEVVQEALDKDCNLVITHHPLIFKPLQAIATDAYKGQLIATLIKNDITVFSSHTNYDRGEAGMNEALAARIELENTEILDFDTEEAGIGRIGDIAPMSLQEAIKHVKARLGMEKARLITKKPLTKKVARIAISGGSGAHHMFAAKMKGADLYVTGDVSYHQAHDMLQIGLTALDIGHYAEKIFREALKKELEAYGVEAPIHLATSERDPFQTV